MGYFHPKQGISTLVNHVAEGDNPQLAHVTPIYQTSTFEFTDAASGAATFAGEKEGYIYTRWTNPNLDQTARKIAVLEGLDLLRQQPDRNDEEIVAARLFNCGMSAVTQAILAHVKSGETIIAQEALYAATYHFFNKFAPGYGIEVVCLQDNTPQGWEDAFKKHPKTTLAYAESPSNPTMSLTDLGAVAEVAHRHGAWLAADNTFASSYCQRPLTLGADVVLHSTTKYLSGHGVVVGGVVVSRHVDYIKSDLFNVFKTFGGAPSPFDAWLTNLGLKTYELRMQRHVDNAMQVARYLEGHPSVARVNYPGLESHPDNALAQRQMTSPGGMLSFELKGGLQAGETLMNRVRVCSLAVSLGTVGSLISHPASMTHASVPREERLKTGVSDGLVRFSVGTENVGDILEDLEQGLK